jgi:hypothetical protein
MEQQLKYQSSNNSDQQRTVNVPKFYHYIRRKTLRTFEITEIFRFNLSNEPFLIDDSADPDHIIAFASKTPLNYLGIYTIILINKQVTLVTTTRLTLD